MSEIRSIIAGATSNSLVLIDEICRGTETAKGTCIAVSVIETLDAIGCLGIVSTHLHGIFDLPLRMKNAVFKSMGTECIDNQTMSTWRLICGSCKESLAFETAQREGVPEALIQRAEELYLSVYSKDKITQIESKLKDYKRSRLEKEHSPANQSLKSSEILCKEVENAVIGICGKNVNDFFVKKDISEPQAMRCVLIGPREQPPPSTIGASSVYVMLRPDRKSMLERPMISRVECVPPPEGGNAECFISLLLGTGEEHGLSAGNSSYQPALYSRVPPDKYS